MLGPNALAQANQIDPKLGDRINTWVEERHELVHRIILSKPFTNRDEFWSRVKDLSKSVFVSSAELTAELVRLFIAYAEKMPQAQAWLRENQASFDTFLQFGNEVRAKVR